MVSVTDYRKPRQEIMEFPWVYPSLNEVNGWHWTKQRKNKAKFEEKTVMLIKQCYPYQFTGQVKIDIDLCFRIRRKRDLVDNYSPKWLLDALQRAGVIRGDDQSIIPEPCSVQIYSGEPFEKMMVRITELK